MAWKVARHLYRRANPILVLRVIAKYAVDHPVLVSKLHQEGVMKLGVRA
jgi:hypothetical protein